MWFLGVIKKPVSAYRSSAAKRVALALAEFWSLCFVLLRPQADDQIGAMQNLPDKRVRVKPAAGPRAPPPPGAPDPGGVEHTPPRKGPPHRGGPRAHPG